MTATEELRRMLDERGVEWRERVWGGKHSVTTFWPARGVRWHYRENRFGELRLHADGLTPEQAVEATLGRGTCTADETETWDGVCASRPIRQVRNLTIHVMECSACGRTFEHVNGLYRFCPHCRARIEGGRIENQSQAD